MPLHCNWGDTPAYKLIEAEADTITLSDEQREQGVSVWDTEEWQNKPDIIHVLDNMMCAGGLAGPAIAAIMMIHKVRKITSENVDKVYARMRTFEVVTDTISVTNVGLYDPLTGEYTRPETPARGYPLSPWMLSMYVGYGINGVESSHKEWVDWLIGQPECAKSSAWGDTDSAKRKRVQETYEMYRDSYLREMCNYAMAMAKRAYNPA